MLLGEWYPVQNFNRDLANLAAEIVGEILANLAEIFVEISDNLGEILAEVRISAAKTSPRFNSEILANIFVTVRISVVKISVRFSPRNFPRLNLGGQKSTSKQTHWIMTPLQVSESLIYYTISKL